MDTYDGTMLAPTHNAGWENRTWGGALVLGGYLPIPGFKAHSIHFCPSIWPFGTEASSHGTTAALLSSTNYSYSLMEYVGIKSGFGYWKGMEKMQRIRLGVIDKPSIQILLGETVRYHSGPAKFGTTYGNADLTNVNSPGFALAEGHNFTTGVAMIDGHVERAHRNDFDKYYLRSVRSDATGGFVYPLRFYYNEDTETSGMW